MTQFLMRLWSEEKAENLPEYALLLFLVCLTAVSTVGRLAYKVDNMCSDVSIHMAVATANPTLASDSLGYVAEPPTNTQSKSMEDKKQNPDD